MRNSYYIFTARCSFTARGFIARMGHKSSLHFGAHYKAADAKGGWAQVSDLSCRFQTDRVLPKGVGRGKSSVATEHLGLELARRGLYAYGTDIYILYLQKKKKIYYEPNAPTCVPCWVYLRILVKTSCASPPAAAPCPCPLSLPGFGSIFGSG